MKYSDKCIFCKEGFPKAFQVVSAEPEHWLFIHNIKPQADYHCLVVLKKEVIIKNKIKGRHGVDIGDARLPDGVLTELGKVLNRSCRAIKRCDKNIERILVLSLNTGEGTEHLHFHLIPKRKKEKIRTVNNPNKRGGGMFFLARKEIVADTLNDYFKATCGDQAEVIKKKYEKAVESRVKRNVERLRKNFE